MTWPHLPPALLVIRLSSKAGAPHTVQPKGGRDGGAHLRYELEGSRVLQAHRHSACNGHRRHQRDLQGWRCPANHESAGKQKRRGTRKGNTYLKATLVTAAVSASQAKGTYLRDKFHRLKARMGTKKAAMAVAHKILVAVFHRLQRGAIFADLGGD